MKEVVRVFDALSDPTRLRIVALLLERDLCVCELVFILKMSQSRVSHQLRVLRDAGLAEDKRDRQWMIYGIPPRVRGRLKLVFDSWGVTARGKVESLAADGKNLRLCLAQNIRKSGKAAPEKGE